MTFCWYRPHITPPRPASALAGDEDADEQAPDAVAERLDHLAVLHAGADQQADLGAGERPAAARRRRRARRRPRSGGTSRPPRRRSGASRAAPRAAAAGSAPGPRSTLISSSPMIIAAHGDQDLLQVLAVDRPHDEALEGQADRAGDEPSRPASRGEHRQQVAPQARGAGPVAHARRARCVATKAPSAMNTPWPKFSTSIRPNTSVRPEAMMKMIMPIARPATVSVTQVEAEPTTAGDSATRRRATSGTRRRQRLSSAVAAALRGDGGVRRHAVTDAPQRQAEQRLLQRLVLGELGHRARGARRGRCPSPPRVSPSALARSRCSARPAGSSSPLRFSSRRRRSGCG